jgi:hypothetical protein
MMIKTFAASALLATACGAYAQNADWMGQIIHTGTWLSDITIPGTHDSAATVDFTIGPIAYTDAASAQKRSITAQLNDGVRFLDIRLREGTGPDQLVPAHGPALQPGTANGIFSELSNFLALHPHEMVLVSIKHEADPLPGRSNIDDAEFQRRVELLLLQPTNRAMVSPLETVPQYSYGSGAATPMPDRIKGRVILVRRYPLANPGSSAPHGIDAWNGWPENGTGNVGSTLRVEDRYDFHCFAADVPCIQAAPGDKRDEVAESMNEAMSSEGGWNANSSWTSQNRIRLIFASATSTDPVSKLPPPGIIPYFSNAINPVIQGAANRNRARAGVLILDREEPSLATSIINMNRLRPFEYDGSGTTAHIDPASHVLSYTMPNGSVVKRGGGWVGTPVVSGGANPQQMSVFAVGINRHLWTSWQTSAGSSTFSNWVDLGGILTSNPAAVRLCSGVMQVFARGTDNALWTIWQVSPGGHWVSPWQSLGGIIHSRPSVRLSGCDAVVSAIGADGRTWAINRNDRSRTWGAWYLQ